MKNPLMLVGGLVILGANLIHFVSDSAAMDILQILGCLGGAVLVFIGFRQQQAEREP